MNEQEKTELITKVLAGEASTDEIITFTNWRNESDTNNKFALQIESVWNNTDVPNDNIDVDAAWQKVAQKIKTKKQTSYLTLFLRIAAILILVAGAGLFLNKWLRSNAFNTMQTATNESKEITLPDGSIVWLNKNSNISYNNNFEGNTRNVELHGEAFFEVQKNPNKPFVITTKYAVTQVLGTSFNLVAYDSLTETTLSVKTGKVSFTASKTNHQLIITANESAVINEQGQVQKDEAFNNNAMAWKNKELVFNNATFNEVVKAIEKYYAIKVTISNPKISNCHFTGTFNNATLNEVLNIISKTLQISYTQNNNNIDFNGKGCE